MAIKITKHEQTTSKAISSASMVTVMVAVLLLLVSAIFISNFLGDVYATPEGDDRDALIAFKDKITADYDNCIESWDSSLVNACTWFHVTCNSENRVTRLDLGGCNMIGELIPELGKLHMLKTMCIYTNSLSGNIPPEFGDLADLTTLDLSDNFLDGSIPKELGNLVNLRLLRLQDNNLNGTVPDELANIIPRIAIVDLTNNEGDGGLKGPCTQQACIR